MSGLIPKLPNNEGVSIMGFTIRDQLNEVGVELNISSFPDGQKQLPSRKAVL